MADSQETDAQVEAKVKVIESVILIREVQKSQRLIDTKPSKLRPETILCVNIRLKFCASI